MRITLRPAQRTDEAWLEGVRRAAYQDLFKATWGGWDETRHRRHFEESWRRGHISIIESDGVSVGMVQVFDGADTVEVGEIQILPRYQNRGIGRRVLVDVIDAAHKIGKRVLLSLGLKNDGAYRLYGSLGFHELSRSDTHIHMSCVPEHAPMDRRRK